MQMKSKSTVFLFALLILPVLIFLFLKIFGSNEFEVPVLYQSQNDMGVSCADSLDFPYQIEKSDLFYSTEDSLLLVCFNDGADEDNRINLLTVCENLSNLPVRFIVISKAKTGIDCGISFVSDEIEKLKSCVFLLPESNDMVLVDQEMQIRGFYSLSRDEADRLAVEIDILLKNY